MPHEAPTDCLKTSQTKTPPTYTLPIPSLSPNMTAQKYAFYHFINANDFITNSLHLMETYMHGTSRNIKLLCIQMLGGLQKKNEM